MWYYSLIDASCLGYYSKAPVGQVGATELAPEDGRQVWDGTKWVWPLALIKQRMVDAVDAYRDNLFETELVTWNGHQVQIREVDQKRMTAKGAYAKFALITGSQWPNNSGWIMADNSTVVVTAAQMSDLADTVAARVESIIFKAREHKNAILALSTEAEVKAYNYKTGW